MRRLVLAALLWLPAQLPGGCGRAVAAGEEVLTLEVAANTVACTGEAPRRCLLVREGPEGEWTRFYDPVAGFVHEEGVRYRIQLSRRRVERPLADGSSYEYRLLRVLSREPA